MEVALRLYLHLQKGSHCMSKKIDKKVLLSPVLAAMLGVAGAAGAAEIQTSEAAPHV